MYAFGVLALVLLWTTVSEPPWWLAIATIIAPLWFLPLVLLVPLTLFLRSVWLWLATSLLLALFVLLFNSLFQLEPSSATRPNLALATFNLRYDNGDVEAITSLLLDRQADIIAVQELSPGVADALQRLEDEYPYQSLYPGRAIGLGLLSRFPLEAASYDETHGLQRAVVRVDGVDVAVFNVHLPGPFEQTVSLEPAGLLELLQSYGQGARASRLALLLDGIDDVSGPLIVLGDFNLSERETAYRPLAERLDNAYRESARGFGFTFPKLRGLPLPPFVRIDHVWLTDEVTPIVARVDCRASGSDHCLLAASVHVKALPGAAGP